MIDYKALQTQAESEGRRCTAGALVLDQTGRVFIHRRGWDRAEFPGCWDIVGGHVEPGEGLLEALAREVEEETGWRVADSPQLVYVADWETLRNGSPAPRREFDFVVEVEGNLDQPRLERPEHVEFRWVGIDDLHLFEENRGLDGNLVRRLTELALRSSCPQELTYPHATAFLDPAIADPLEVVRAAWDPAMAAQIAAHVSLAYPAEIDSVDHLAERLDSVAAETGPFRLGLGRVKHFGAAPDEGVFVEILDVDGGWAHARDSLFSGAHYDVDIEPHVTIVHPRTTNRGASAWKHLAGSEFDGVAYITQLSITCFDSRRWITAANFPLGA
jgi:8-oxo-dGTP diphosphatase